MLRTMYRSIYSGLYAKFIVMSFEKILRKNKHTFLSLTASVSAVYRYRWAMKLMFDFKLDNK